MPTRESLTNEKGLAPKLFRGQPLVGYAFIAAVLVPRQRLSPEPAQATLRHDLAEQVDHLGVVGFAGIAREAGVGHGVGCRRRRTGDGGVFTLILQERDALS